MALSSKPRVAVVGATGAVGRVLLDLLVERSFPAVEVIAVASARSEGRLLEFGDSSLTVRALEDDVFEGVDLAIFDTPDEIALEWVPVAVERGAVAVDNSAAWRMHDTVPLVVPEINGNDAFGHQGIIASPNCTTIGVVIPASVLNRRWGLERMVVSSYQATSGAGQPGVEELREQAAKLYDSLEDLGAGKAADIAPEPKVFAAPIAFNAVPLIGSERDLGYTSEEWKLLHESRKIMGMPGLDVSATCVRVPTVVGHGASVFATFGENVDPDEAIELLRGAEGVEVSDVPNPLSVAGRDPVVVGRVRAHPTDPRSLWFFSVSDNLRKGAALNAIQIAELLLRESARESPSVESS
ncbi:MAG TPA: aspartate-semialdehyde dehydrogenase [Actinomycetota bacterium]|nr:aspartate-semialdehyde dehydrogenase [Actinomycetota bacterium]